MSAAPADCVYHRTTAAEAILRGGFRDATDAYLTATEHSGVWVTFDEPWSMATGGVSEDTTLLVIEAPVAHLEQYEWSEDGKHYREALVPAEVLNRYPVWEAWECDECGRVEPARTPGWTRERHPPFDVLITLCDDCA